MGIDIAQLLPEFDAVYAWTSRDRVIIEQMVIFASLFKIFAQVKRQRPT